MVHEMYTLLGIGTFDNSIDEEYLEIMKELAYSQKLYKQTIILQHLKDLNYKQSIIMHNT